MSASTTTTTVNKERAGKYFDTYSSSASSSSSISKSDALAAFCQFFPHEEPVEIMNKISSNNQEKVSKEDFLNIASQLRPPPPTLAEFTKIVECGNIKDVIHAVDVQGFDVQSSLSAEALSHIDDHVPTPVKVCATKNYTDILLFLLRKGADVTGGVQQSLFALGRNNSNGSDSRMSTTTTRKVRPLFVAVSLGRIDITRILLNHGADPCAAGTNGLTPLHLAAQNCSSDNQPTKMRDAYFEILKLLLERVPPNVKFGLLKTDEGWTVLHFAVLSGNEEAVKVVLKNLRSVYARTERDVSGKTALDYAISEEMGGRMIDLVKHYGL